MMETTGYYLGLWKKRKNPVTDYDEDALKRIEK